MPVRHIHSESEFNSLLSPNNNSGGGTGDKLFLVDYSAKWCGPCRNIAPVFESLSNKHGHSNFLFLHVDVDECGDVGQEQGVRALPTFVFYKNSTATELARLQGADPSGLEAKIVELGQKFKAFFGGQGNKLGGDPTTGSSSSSSQINSSSTLSPEEIFSIAQSNISFGSSPSKVGLRFQPQLTGPFGTAKPTVRIDASDKVSKIRLFIDSVLELSGVARSYELHNSYPPGKLDEEKTVSDAGVAGAAVVVKFL